MDIPEAFNWSHFNNRAAEATDGEYLLFLNDDIEITQPDWLDALLEHAQRPEVGIVGPQLLYPGGKVQHAGMFLGAGIGRHAFRFVPGDEPGYFGLALTQRNVIAVTGACMLMRRSFFEAMGGFEEAHSVINNDLDFCLRAHQAGKLTVFTPHASLIHHELASRERMGDDVRHDAVRCALAHGIRRRRSVFQSAPVALRGRLPSGRRGGADGSARPSAVRTDGDPAHPGGEAGPYRRRRSPRCRRSAG